MENLNVTRRLLKPSEVQNFIPGKSAKSLAVERCQRRDTLPFVRYGKRIYYDLSDLEAWIDAHKVDPAKSEAK